MHLILVVKENEGLSQECQQIDFILILLVFTVNLENLGSSQAKLSNFKFTTGEQLRYESTICQDVKCYTRFFTKWKTKIFEQFYVVRAPQKILSSSKSEGQSDFGCNLVSRVFFRHLRHSSK